MVVLVSLVVGRGRLVLSAVRLVGLVVWPLGLVRTALVVVALVVAGQPVVGRLVVVAMALVVVRLVVGLVG